MNEARTAAASPRALHEAIADDLRRRILGRELPAGGAVDEAAWAHFYGVGRAPVREAFKLLGREGLLAARGDSLAVAAPSADELTEAAALRDLLRAHALRQDGVRAQPLHAALLEIVERRLRLGGAQPSRSIANPAAR